MTNNSYSFKANILLGALILCMLASIPHLSSAEDKTPAVSEKTEEAVVYYGHSFYPGRIKFSNSDYTWDDLEYLIPKLLPDAETAKLTLEESCDHIVQMTNLYLMEVGEASNYLAFKLGAVMPDADTDFVLSEKLISRSPQILNELLLQLPEDQSKVITAKDLTLKSLALILLHDAAIAQCPDYAKQKEYFPITFYNEPDNATP